MKTSKDKSDAMILLSLMFESYLELVRLKRRGENDHIDKTGSALSNQRGNTVCDERESENESESERDTSKTAEKEKDIFVGFVESNAMLEKMKQTREEIVAIEIERDSVKEAAKILEERTHDENEMLTTLLVDMMRKSGKKVSVCCSRPQQLIASFSDPTSSSTSRSTSASSSSGLSKNNLSKAVSPKEAVPIEPFGANKGNSYTALMRGDGDTSKDVNKIKNDEDDPIEVRLKDDSMSSKCDVSDHRNKKEVIWQEFYTAEDIKHFQTLNMLDVLKNFRLF